MVRKSKVARRQLIFTRADLDAVIETAKIQVAKRCAEIADGLRAVHAKAYEKADAVGNEDAMCFIAGMRDGASGVGMEIRRNFPVDATSCGSVDGEATDASGK